MKNGNREPMCETSEKGERLIAREDLLPISLDIGRRIMEVFGYQAVSKIVFRLRSNSDEMNAVLNGRRLPSTELLLGIHKLTGVSIDWLLTGNGGKYLPVLQISDRSIEHVPTDLWFVDHERESSLPLQ